MTQRPPKVRFDKPKDRLSPARTDKDMHQIVVLVVEVRNLWHDSVDGGVYSPRTGQGRPSSFEDTDPTHSAATSPTQRQLRAAAKRASTLIAEAKARLEDAERILQNGLLRTDPEVLSEYLEKHQAAVQGR